MKAIIVTPTPPDGMDGNLITARRWARILRELGHTVSIRRGYRGESTDLLIALHAFKSRHSIQRFSKKYPRKALIVVLSGTDLYRDLHRQTETLLSLQLATHLVALQPRALSELTQAVGAKTSVVYQSAKPLKGSPPKTYFRVLVAGNLRPEKDPFRTAMASRLLPVESRIQIWHLGQALSPAMERKALDEANGNGRYRWMGALPHWKSRRLISNSHLVALTSRMEGSSNVLSEALAASVPVIASRIPGLIGTLGEGYPGYFPVGDTRALAEQLKRAETDPDFYGKLRQRCVDLSRLVRPQREKMDWKLLLEKLG
jgi:putative glycosyltransferase (TIGR04348 family)